MRRRAFLILIAFIGSGILSVVFFRTSVQDKTPAEAVPEAGSEVHLAPPSPSSGASASPIQIPQVDAATKSKMIDCVRMSPTFGGQSSTQDFDSIDEFLRRGRGGESPQRELESLSLHATDAKTGERLRLLISKHSSEEAGLSMKVQIFGVGLDGLPLLKRLPDEYRNLTASQVTDKFLREYPDVSRRESREILRWENGESANVTQINGVTTELQVFMGDGTSLGCSSSKCRCLAD